MTKPDRDRSIEQLLRHVPSNGRALDGHCPDAETLAALADDALTADERRSVEAHVADCHACQMLTAAVARAETSAHAPADDHAAVPWWKTGRLIRYLAPASAAAIAVALWIAVPDEQTPLGTGQSSLEQEAPAAQPVTQSAAPPEERFETRAEETQPQAGADAAAPALGRLQGQVRARAGEAPRGFEPSAPVDETPAAIGQVAESQSAASQDQSARAQPDSAAPGPEPLLRREAAGEAAAGASAAAPPPLAASPPAPPPSPAAAAPLPAARQAAALADAAKATTVDVVSPDPRIRWRIGAGAALQYSADGGATWATQPIGVFAQLTAGSSPSATVCWIVGRSGTVLRTVDGGSQWQRVPFPDASDLTGVTASTALDAAVTTADGRRLRTSDGGRSWTPARD